MTEVPTVPTDDTVSEDDVFTASRPNRTRSGAAPDRAPKGSGRRSAEEPFVPFDERISRWWNRQADLFRDEPGRVAEAALTVAVILLATGLVLATLHPTDLWKDTTPTGGDMGAHVWGPRYLLDELLPNFRLSGWSPDWYDGFPAYQFYMVVPSLLIVAIHVGLVWYLAVPVVLAALAVTVLGWARRRLYPYRYLIAAAAAAVVVLAVPMPYNRSFKLVTALGLLGLPVACWAFAKLADLPFPIPPLTAAGGLLFIYNREPIYNNTGNIIGGNFQSTMAGEFAFSISLTLAVLYLGVAARGLRTGRHRALAAALFALAGLCHLIPAFFVLACTAGLFLVHPDRGRLKWLATMVPVAGLLTAFWVLPFWWRRDYVNDMGWEKLPAPGANAATEAKNLAGDQASAMYYLFPSGMRWLMVAALVGVVGSFLRRYTVGMVLAIAWAGAAVGFVALPQYRLWNARLLPFLYLSVALLAAIGIGELIRLAGAVASGRAERPLRPVTLSVAALAALGVVIYAALPVSNLFEGAGQPISRKPIAVQQADGTTGSKSKSSFLLFDTVATNPVAGWSAWNYSGLEEKEAQPAGCDAPDSTAACTSGGWPEYRDLMSTMGSLGANEKFGCGRAFWEYDGPRINGYGTPMAPMLLPYWTDGCIGSQEGLYFESSTTVPYHFLMQSELSAKPSQPQRELPYPGFDIAAGVEHLQLMGVKYYMAVSTQAVGAAALHPDLTEVAVSGPWHVYQVADSPLVSPLTYEPVVAQGLGTSQEDWLPTATAWFLDPERRDVTLAVDGPDDWKRVQAEPVPVEWRRVVRYAREQLGLTGPMDEVPEEPRTKLPEVQVSDIEQTNDSMSFTVSKPGVPVLVKASYFPNWEVSGADGPYRVTPNLMVVIPRERHVTMTYGRTPVDLMGAGLTVIGLIGLVFLARRQSLDLVPFRPGRASARLDRMLTLRPKRVVDAPPEAAGRWEPEGRAGLPPPPGHGPAPDHPPRPEGH
ncbi:MAG: hypothetical protein H0U29_10140 [Acidimicrobiia bacterium]|nr:hypothetical protein [Acidimicrobiia bacterium]